MPSRNIDRWLVLAGIIVTSTRSASGWSSPGCSLATIYVAPFFNWVLTFNPGAAFSFLSDAGGWQRWFFTVLALAIAAWIVSILPRHSGEFRLSLALTLILGGALGNVIDRLRFGAVIDFVQWHVAGFYWPAFNIADSAICIGALLMAWDQFAARPAERGQRGERRRWARRCLCRQSRALT